MYKNISEKKVRTNKSSKELPMRAVYSEYLSLLANGEESTGINKLLMDKHNLNYGKFNYILTKGLRNKWK